MDEMTGAEINAAIDKLDRDEREYLKLIISRVVRCFVQDDNRCVMVFSTDSTGVSVCAANASETDALELLNRARDTMTFALTMDAPAKEMFN